MNVLIPYFQNKNEEYQQQLSRKEALEKTNFDSDNAILDWRIANNLLERKKLELEAKIDELSPTENKITELEIEEMQYKVDKLANQIKNINGIKNTSNICT